MILAKFTLFIYLLHILLWIFILLFSIDKCVVFALLLELFKTSFDLIHALMAATSP